MYTRPLALDLARLQREFGKWSDESAVKWVKWVSLGGTVFDQAEGQEEGWGAGIFPSAGPEAFCFLTAWGVPKLEQEQPHMRAHAP